MTSAGKSPLSHTLFLGRHNMTKFNKIVTGVRDILSENHYLVSVLVVGFILVLSGFVPEYRETVFFLGIALIITSSVGIHMMLTTRRVASGLHDRFDKLNDIASSQNSILEEIASSQKEIASSQNSILEEIASSQKEIASSQNSILKEIASTQHNVEDILKRIEEKITVTPSG